jgi:hypothetical protein
MESDSNPPVENEILLNLSFVPKWAQAPAGQNPYAHFPDPGRDSRMGDSRRPYGAQGAARVGGRSGDRPSRDDRRDRRAPRRDERHPDAPGPRREPVARPAERPAPPETQVPPMDVRFLPERKYLGAVVKRIQKSRRAYPLAKLAGLFLSNPDFHLVKFELEGRTEPGHRLAQCDVCKALFLSATAAIEHFSASHREDYFTAQERELPPPTGQFNCVVRCRMGGDVLGPPNHHSYNDRLLELHTSRCPDLSLDEFRRTLETIHDPEAVEAWKTSCRIQRVTVRRDDPEAKPVPPAEVKNWLAGQATAHVHEVSRAVLPAPVARASRDRIIQSLVRETWNRESRFPLSLMISLRPAMRHMGLHLFKAGGNMTFVTAVSPAPIDPAHAIEPIRQALQYVQAHPGTTREIMLKDLFPEGPPEAIQAVVSHLLWLTDKGHLIEFFDGSLAVPSHLPAPVRKPPGTRAPAGS